MQCTRFIGREAELRVLEEAWRNRPGFIVVYGRRGIGKTRLVKEFLSRHRGVYYLAQLSSHEYNLRRLAIRLAEYLGEEFLVEIRVTKLHELLRMFIRSGGDDLVLVLDEFTYWVRSSPRVLEELREFINKVLPHTRILLIVIGSLVRVMRSRVLRENIVSSNGGRRRIRLGQLEFRYVKYFTPRYTSSERVRLYALFGGIPYYLCLVDDRQPIADNIRRLVLEPSAPVRAEKDLLLREELRDPHTYNAVLSAIAKGYDRPSKIAEITGIDSSHVSKYLYVLESLGVIKREVFLFKRKKSIYRIIDPILRTWFYLVEPIQELVDLELVDDALEYVTTKLQDLVQTTWEDLVREYLLKKHGSQGYVVSGRLGCRGEGISVALVNHDERKVIVSEVKWSKNSISELEEMKKKLEAKAHRLLPADYTVEKAYVAVEDIVDGVSEKPSWIILPRDLEQS